LKRGLDDFLDLDDKNIGESDPSKKSDNFESIKSIQSFRNYKNELKNKNRVSSEVVDKSIEIDYTVRNNVKNVNNESSSSNRLDSNQDNTKEVRTPNNKDEHRANKDRDINTKSLIRKPINKDQKENKNSFSGLNKKNNNKPVEDSEESSSNISTNSVVDKIRSTRKYSSDKVSVSINSITEHLLDSFKDEFGLKDPVDSHYMQA